MFKKFIKFLLLLPHRFSFKNLFQPILKRLIRIVFSDRKTAVILHIIGGVFVVFRILSAVLGILIFINYTDLSNIWSAAGIFTLITTYFRMIRDGFLSSIDKLFPHNPSTPTSKVIEEVGVEGL